MWNVWDVLNGFVACSLIPMKSSYLDHSTTLHGHACSRVFVRLHRFCSARTRQTQFSIELMQLLTG